MPRYFSYFVFQMCIFMFLVLLLSCCLQLMAALWKSASQNVWSSTALLSSCRIKPVASYKESIHLIFGFPLSCCFHLLLVFVYALYCTVICAYSLNTFTPSWCHMFKMFWLCMKCLPFFLYMNIWTGVFFSDAPTDVNQWQLTASTNFRFQLLLFICLIIVS